jgi:GT2 family glycosyltransferase
VIPNYNGEHLLPESLQKVYEAVTSYSGIAEVIVVDDASEDGSVLLIKDRFPGTKVVGHSENRGFSETVKTGVQSSSHDIIILLNSDVFPERGFIEPLMRWFDYEDTFSVSPLVYNTNGVPMQVSWNIIDIVRGDIRSKKWNLENAIKARHVGKPLISLFASGGSIALRKDMFLELDGYLALYKPFYYEDCDLGTRAWEKGWKTYFEPESRVIHKHNSTISRFFSSLKIRTIKKRNRFIFLWLHLSAEKIFLSHIPWLTVRICGRLLRFDAAFIAGLLNALFYIQDIRHIRSLREKNGQGLWLEGLSMMIKRGFEEIRS